MPRVVLDTNVLVSSLITRGKARELWLKAVDKKLTLVTSAQIVKEFMEAMRREKFKRYVDTEDIERFTRILIQTAKMTRVRSKHKVVREDPDDDIIINTAHDGGAEYIVSGDGHLLTLKRLGEIKIVTVTEMLNILREQQPF